jgi:hypothetical protein
MTILKILKKRRNQSIYIDFQKAYFKEIKKERERKKRKEQIKEIRKTIKEKSKITYIDKYGYRRFNDSHRLVSRWMVEKKIGRRLKSEEVVHHIDGDKLNNNKTNLRVFPSQEIHENHHKRNLRLYGSWYEIIPEKYTYST